MVGPDQMSRLESVILTEFNSTLQTVHSDMSLAVAESDNVTQSLVTLRGRPQIEFGKFNSHKNESRAILLIVFVPFIIMSFDCVQCRSTSGLTVWLLLTGTWTALTWATVTKVGHRRCLPSLKRGQGNPTSLFKPVLMQGKSNCRNGKEKFVRKDYRNNLEGKLPLGETQC